MNREYGERARFLTVYIKEAHPEDEWQMDSNEEENVCYPQPRTLGERVAIANDFVKRFDYDVPMAVDGMENVAEKAYAAWPERFYVVEDGRVAYKGEVGPFGFKPDEVENWLKARFRETGAR
jgi:type I thyroxine 5'-deiodinase